MALPYATAPTSRRTSQSQPIPGRQAEMAKNDVGGFTFTLSPREQVERFLILGSESGTYYVGKETQLARNSSALITFIKSDGVDAVNMIVDVSTRGRAPKNEPCVFALAQCFVNGDPETKKAAEAALPQVCRIGTDIQHFAAYIQAFGSWNKTLRRAVGNWYTHKAVDKLAYQVAKYQQRDGMSHLDVMRLAHPKVIGDAADYRLLVEWIKGRVVDTDGHPTLAIIEGMNAIKGEPNLKKAAKLITKYGLTHEMIPTELKNSKEIWEALLEKMPLNAMVRNLGKMSQIGLLDPLSQAAGKVTTRLGDQEYIRKSRLHPLALLIALKTYSQGKGFKGSLEWVANQRIVDALDAALYLAFDNVVPSGKTQVLAIDCSASMTWPESNLAGTNVQAREAAAVMAMVTAKVEPNYHVLGFCNARNAHSARSGLVDLNISPKMRLDAVCAAMGKVSAGGTDCSLPMLWARQEQIKDVGGFVIYTDNDTWAGTIHPSQALQQYRRELGARAKMAVVATIATPFTIADPKDAGMMDFVGFDTAAPAVLADFLRK